MSKTLEYFMWGYQSHFQIAVQIAAEDIFKMLDPKLLPKVFLIGVLMEERTDRHPICVEPEECGYDPDWFSGLLEDTAHLEALDVVCPRKNRVTVAPKVQSIWGGANGTQEQVQ